MRCSSNAYNYHHRCPDLRRPPAAVTTVGRCRGVFVVGIALILFNRIEWEKTPDPVRG